MDTLEKIEINGVAYQIQKEDEKASLLRYNEKHKIWVKLNFSDTATKNSIVEVLSKQYISTHSKL